MGELNSVMHINNTEKKLQRCFECWSFKETDLGFSDRVKNNANHEVQSDESFGYLDEGCIFKL